MKESGESRRTQKLLHPLFFLSAIHPPNTGLHFLRPRWREGLHGGRRGAQQLHPRGRGFDGALILEPVVRFQRGVGVPRLPIRPVQVRRQRRRDL